MQSQNIYQQRDNYYCSMIPEGLKREIEKADYDLRR
jgi:hypothetical protein